MKKTSPKKISLNVTMIVLTALMIFMITIVAIVAANNREKNPDPEYDLTVLEPVEVEMNGSVKLDVEYATCMDALIESHGEEWITLTIAADEDNPDQYKVYGTLLSTQDVAIAGGTQAYKCWLDIRHKVVYDVTGTFTTSTCKFELTAVMEPSASTLMGHDCPADPMIEIKHLYLAPVPGKLVFTKAFEVTSNSKEWKFSLFDVDFPSAINCSGYTIEY